MKIYNSLTRKKSDFIPIEPNKVSMYVCGMTIYDYCHIGHARMMLVFDMINRYLTCKDYDVTYVRNITDIDDKIINRANERNEHYKDVTKYFIAAMREDEAQLKMIPPTIEPLATDSIEGMIALIEKLIDKGHAYRSDSGDVLYSVESFPEYGKVSNQDIDALQAGQRIAVDESKHNPLDFVLWKKAKPNEPSWSSPWGEGRPGWHIECSVMSYETLGKKFDIHGGGLDLKFPHHDCEVAQSEPVYGKDQVNYWVHNGFINVDDEKMSKSLGNFFTIRDVLEKFSGEVIRFFMLGTHYRSPINYSDVTLNEAKVSLDRLYSALRDVDASILDNEYLKTHHSAFFNAMDDDFNTAKAISELFTLAKAINKTENDTEKTKLASALKSLGSILGILQDEPEVFLQGTTGDNTEIDTLVEARNQARTDKDWAKADEIRNQLDAMGIVIEDKDGKTTWRMK